MLRSRDGHTDTKQGGWSEVYTLTSTVSTTSSPNVIAKSQQVAEGADSKQEEEVRDIIGTEVIDSLPHYWVEWRATSVPKYELKKARALVEKWQF